MSSSRPPLTQAHASIQLVAPELLDLPHAVHCISAFLDVSTRIALPAAASRGSLVLLERVAQRLINDQHLSPAMLKHWFGRAMQVAIETNNLVMVQKIHSHHPEPLVLYSLQLALKHGTLETVQWIVEHRHDRLCCAPGIQNVCRQCLVHSLLTCLGGQDASSIFQWLDDEGIAPTLLEDGYVRSQLLRSALKSVDLLRWFDKHGLVSKATAETLLRAAISSESADDLAVVEYLVGRGFTLATEALVEALIDGSCQKHKEPVVEVVVASHLCDEIRDQFEYAATRLGGAKVLQWTRAFLEQPGNEEIPGRIFYKAINFGHVDTLQWIHAQGYARQCRGVGIPSLQSEQDMIRCCEAVESMGFSRWTAYNIDNVARFGYLEVVQWLLTHGEVACTPSAMDFAAGFGHLHVVKWLHENRTEGCSSRAMEMAAGNGHLEVVQWLCEHRSEHKTTRAMACAAVHGQLNVLVWLHETQLDACTSCATNAVLMSADTMGPAKGVLNGLRWLRENPPSVVCEGSCYGLVSHPAWIGLKGTTGDLELLQYLTQYYPESWPTQHNDRLRLAAALGQAGHLGVIQWVHKNRRDAVDWDQVRRAALSPQFQHEAVVAWLDGELSQ